MFGFIARRKQGHPPTILSRSDPLLLTIIHTIGDPKSLRQSYILASYRLLWSIASDLQSKFSSRHFPVDLSTNCVQMATPHILPISASEFASMMRLAMPPMGWSNTLGNCMLSDMRRRCAHGPLRCSCRKLWWSGFYLFTLPFAPLSQWRSCQEYSD